MPDELSTAALSDVEPSVSQHLQAVQGLPSFYSDFTRFSLLSRGEFLMETE